jgi:hypothetical protein
MICCWFRLPEIWWALQAAGFKWKEIDLTRSGTNPFNEIRAIIQLTRLYKRSDQTCASFHQQVCGLWIDSCKIGRNRSSCKFGTGIGYVFTKKNLTFFT